MLKRSRFLKSRFTIVKHRVFFKKNVRYYHEKLIENCLSLNQLNDVVRKMSSVLKHTNAINMFD